MAALTWLYVPADRPERIAKALASGADAVIVDLEDAVAAGAKDAAREGLAEALAGASLPVQVRVNAIGSPWHEADCAAVAGLDAAVEVRVPKVESPKQIRKLTSRLPGRRLHLLVESALGVERAYELARASREVASIGLGEADLRSDLRVTGTEGLAHSRARIVVAARAAGLPSPSMSAYANVQDLEGLAADCRAGRTIGFLGRAAIHPRQLPVIREAFAPTEAEVERAREVIERVGEASANDAGVVVLADGTFLDAAMVGAARAVLEAAEAARPR